MTIGRLEFIQGASTPYDQPSVAITANDGEGVVLGLINNNSGVATTSWVCSTGETVTARTARTADGRSYTFAYIKALVGTGVRTITANLAASAYPFNASVVAWRVSGHDTTTFFDAEAWSSTTSSSPSILLATQSANAAIFELFNGNYDPISGFTRETVADNYFYDEGGYKLDNGASGDKAVGFDSGGVTIGWFISAIAIKKAGGGTPATIKYWDVPTDAANGTTGKMVVLADNYLTVIDQGSVTAASGHFQLVATNQALANGTPHWAPTWDVSGGLSDTVYKGGVAVATIVEV